MTASPIAAATVSFNPETRLFIDGQLRESSTGKTVDNINPATEEVLGVATDAGADDMDEAIAAADTLLLTVPNQLGVEYNAHVIESFITHVAPAL